MSVLYHPGKANVVADTFSRMTMGSVSHVEQKNKELVKNVHRLARLGLRLEDYINGRFMVHHKSDSLLLVEVKSKQHLDPLLMELKDLVLSKLNELFSQEVDGVLRYDGRLFIGDVEDLG